VVLGLSSVLRLLESLAKTNSTYKMLVVLLINQKDYILVNFAANHCFEFCTMVFSFTLFTSLHPPILQSSKDGELVYPELVEGVEPFANPLISDLNYL